MLKTSLLRILLILSATRIIYSIPVPDDYSEELTSTSTLLHTSPASEDITTELQNIEVCDTFEQRAACEAFLEAHINKGSEEYRNLETLKLTSKLLESWSLPLPILAVVGKRFTDLILVLLRNGLPINKNYTSLEETLLHAAADQGDDYLITLLLTKGADIEVKNKDGDTPLHIAVSKFKSTTVKLLLDSGADVNVINKKGETALFKAVDYLCPEYKTNRTEIKNWVIVKNIIKLLLEHGANTNIANYLGNTALHVAAKNSNVTIVQLLIDGGANINATDDSHKTPLHKATESNNVSVVEYLVKMGCDKTITDSNKKTALDIAKENNYTEIVDLLSRKT